MSEKINKMKTAEKWISIIQKNSDKYDSIGFSLIPLIEAIQTEVWNEAIETAAKMVEYKYGGIKEDILTLKK